MHNAARPNLAHRTPCVDGVKNRRSKLLPCRMGGCSGTCMEKRTGTESQGWMSARAAGEAAELARQRRPCRQGAQRAQRHGNAWEPRAWVSERRAGCKGREAPQVLPGVLVTAGFLFTLLRASPRVEGQRGSMCGCPSLAFWCSRSPCRSAGRLRRV